MDPTSPEARTILRFYDLTYDEVMFYESHHQIGKYVSRLVLKDKPRSGHLLMQSSCHIVASRWYNCDGVGSYRVYVSIADENDSVSSGSIESISWS